MDHSITQTPSRRLPHQSRDVSTLSVVQKSWNVQALLYKQGIRTTRQRADALPKTLTLTQKVVRDQKIIFVTHLDATLIRRKVVQEH